MSNASARRGTPWIEIAVIILAVAIVPAFAGLIPLGTWRVDEYHDFGLYRLRGWSYFFERLLTWSPRPLSEVIAGFYYLAEEGTGRQLLAPFLALMWLPLLLGPALHVWRGRPGAVGPRLLVVAVVLCFFLVGHHVAEVFYWPMGSVAYATTLAAIGALTFQVIDGRWMGGHGRTFCIVALLCAAGSAELGAIMSIYVAAVMIMLHVTGRIGAPAAARPWLLPLVVGIVVMIALALGRGRLDENIVYGGISPNPTYLKHPIASVLRTFPTYFRQLIVLDGTLLGRSAFAWGAPIKAGLCVGLLAVIWAAPGPALTRQTRWVLAGLLLALQATFFTSIAGSYYKFGLVCCERHDTMRQCLMVLSILSAVTLIASVLPKVQRPDRLSIAGASILGLTLLVSLARELPGLQKAYAAWPTSIAVRHANWDSGHAPGERMTLLMLPLLPVVDGLVPPERGTLRRDAHPPWIWDLVMTFFDKQEIELKPVTQMP